jgi:beta-lactamase regulating signal transducer with metallopeptidase domain
MLWWALKGSAILTLAFAATALLRRRPAAVRHAVWTIAVAAQLLLPLAELTRRAPMVAVPPILSPATPLPMPVFRRADTDRPIERAPLRLDLVWPVVSALLLLRLLFGIVRIARLQRHARPLNAAAEEVRMPRGVALRITEALAMPLTWGWRRPAILLPATSVSWPAALRRHVLLHELAHVRRRDALTQCVAQLALALFWFNPLLWLAVRRMREEAEHACDDHVLRSGERPSVYAETLVQLVGVQTGASAFPALSAGTELERRVEALTRAHRDASARPALVATAVAITLLLAMPISGVRRAARFVARPCHPMLIEHFPYRGTTGTLTADGVTTHYFFERPADGRCLEASFPLDVRFTAGTRDVVPTPALRALVHETLGGTDRLVLLEERGGRLVRRYVVNGVETAWDADAERWYGRVMPDAIARTLPSVAEHRRER